MKTIKLEYFEVTDVESEKVKYRVSNASLANLLCMGDSFLKVVDVNEDVQVFETLEEVRDFDKEKAIKKALSKLTDYERQLLGL